MKLHIHVNGKSFTATLENNPSVTVFINKIKKEPLILTMKDYSGFEKVGILGFSLPVHNKEITTASGDIMLYQGKQIVLFYGANTWSYTKLGSIDDQTGWKEALGNHDVNVQFSVE